MKMLSELFKATNVNEQQQMGIYVYFILSIIIMLTCVPVRVEAGKTEQLEFYLVFFCAE